MGRFVDGPVSVSVPATSANLGPGFDTLGLALDLRDELEAQVVDSGLHLEVEGAGADDVPRDESHLVVRAMRAGFAAMAAEPPGLRLHCRNRIPHSRGLGSSSAAIVAGLCLARGLVAGGSLLLDDDRLLRLATDLEGHPDNVAPAFLGGFVIAGREDEQVYAVRCGVDPRVSAVVFVPPDGVRTEVARGLLPDVVSHRDASDNAGRAALLVAALGSRPDLLLPATRDRLHQDYREPAMPASLALVHALRRQGHPALVSGAGPTVLCFTHEAEDLAPSCPDGWEVHHLALDPDGARVDVPGVTST